MAHLSLGWGYLCGHKFSQLENKLLLGLFNPIVTATPNEIERLKDGTKVARRLRDVDVPDSEIRMMADDAISKERVLRNNPRVMGYGDIVGIYEAIA